MSSYQNIRLTSLYEPRIEFIKRQLESLLTVVELESGGQVVPIDGFRLRRLKDWLSPSTGNPEEVFQHAATRCDCDCIFCYNRGNPPGLGRDNARAVEEEFQEMMARVEHFHPRDSLFPCLGDTYEALIHPHIIDVLGALRRRTGQPFRITTNGRALTRDMVAALAALRPVYLYLSLNSASAERRRRLMGDPTPQVAIDSLPLLQEAAIPYAVLICPWPLGSLEETLDDMERTVAYAQGHGAHLVEINLPGYTRFFSSEELFDLDEVWSAAVARVRAMRGRMAVPIVTMPSMYEENLGRGRKNLPGIIGVVAGSPAQRAGCAHGDGIRAVNGIPVTSRPQARDLLSLLQRSSNRGAAITVERGGQVLELPLDLEDTSYPYDRETDTHLGVVFLGTGLRTSYLEQLKGLIERHGARRCLFLSSALVRPTFEQCLAESTLFADPGLTIDVQVPPNRFFGGNVFMGDLLVVQDFIDFLKDYLARGGPRPDLVVIPSSPFNLGGWGRDLTGRVYLDIEREVGIPVALLECATIYD